MTVGPIPMKEVEVTNAIVVRNSCKNKREEKK